MVAMSLDGEKKARAAIRAVEPASFGRRWNGGSSPPPARPLLERGHHLVGQESQAPRLELLGNAPARVELGHDSVEPQLVAQLRQPIDHALRGAERDLLGEDVVV